MLDTLTVEADAAKDAVQRALPLIFAYAERFKTFAEAERYVEAVVRVKRFEYTTAKFSTQSLETIKMMVLREVTRRVVVDGRLQVQEKYQGEGLPLQLPPQKPATPALKQAPLQLLCPPKLFMSFISPQGVVKRVSEAILKKITEVQRIIPNKSPHFADFKAAKTYVRTLCARQKVNLLWSETGIPSTSYFIATVVVHSAVREGLFDIGTGVMPGSFQQKPRDTVIGQVVTELLARRARSLVPTSFAIPKKSNPTVPGCSKPTPRCNTSGPALSPTITTKPTASISETSRQVVSPAKPASSETAEDKVQVEAACVPVIVEGRTVADVRADALAMRFALAEQLLFKLDLPVVCLE